MAKHSWRELLGTLRGLLQTTPAGTPTYHQPDDPVLQAGVVLVDDVVEELSAVEKAKNTAEAQCRAMRGQLQAIAQGHYKVLRPWVLSGMKKLSKRERKILAAYQEEIELNDDQLQYAVESTLNSLSTLEPPPRY